MAINLENELKTISVQLKALSKRVDEMADGIGIPKISKRKVVFKKGASLAEVPINKNALEIKSDVSSVSTNSVEDVEPDILQNPQTLSV